MPVCACVAVRLQIGVVGWITPTTGETSRDVGGVKFTPIVPSVKACLDILNKEQPNLDFVIGLSHSGVSGAPVCGCDWHKRAELGVGGAGQKPLATENYCAELLMQSQHCCKVPKEPCTAYGKLHARAATQVPAQAQVPRLKLVVMSSVAATVSMPGYEDDMITAQQVPGLDVIVGGHSHTFLYTPITAGPIVARGPGVNASTCVQKVRTLCSPLRVGLSCSAEMT